MAGLISTPVSNLISRDGETVSLVLKKCIDQKAIASIKINHVWIQKSDKKIRMAQSSGGGGILFQANQTSRIKGQAHVSPIRFETRSEFQGTPLKPNPTGVIGSHLHKNLFETPRNNIAGRNFVGVVPKINFKNEFGNSFEDLRESRTVGGGGMRLREKKSK